MDVDDEKGVEQLSDEEKKEDYEPGCGAFGRALDRYFEVSKRHSTLATEVLAGITTFLSMAYILTVNPDNLTMDNSGRWPSVFIATCFGSIVGTLLMAFFAKMPYAQAPGMGLNSAIGLLVAMGDGQGHAFSYDNAMALGFIYAVAVLVISLIPVGKDAESGNWITLREKLFDGVPPCVRESISVGIGLFIAFIGFQDSKMVLGNQFVLVSLVDFTKLWVGSEEGDVAKSALVCFVTLIAIAVLVHYEVRGGVLIGLLIGTIIAIPLRVANLDVIAGKTEGVSWKFWKNFENYFRWDSERGGIFLGMFRGFNFDKGTATSIVMNVISLGMVDLFDTMGTIVGCATKAELNDDNGKPQGYGRVMISDSIAAVTAYLFGTSSVTTFVESGTGIAAGGKTGLLALVVALMFLLSILILPVFAFIPSAAAGAALIYVGVLMMSTVGNIDFSEVHNALPAFLTIAMMPFTYSITKGIGFGMLSYSFVQVIEWIVGVCIYLVKPRPFPEWPLGIVSIVISALFLVYFLVPSS